MKEKIVQHLKNITSAKVLAVAFLAFSVYVGMAAFPQFLTNSGEAWTENESIAEYIEKIDSQYHDMLSTKTEFPALQNKGTYVNFNGLMANILDQVMVNNRIKLKNGYLSSTGASFSKNTLDNIFVNIQNLHQRQNEKGKHFLFVLAPSKTWKSEMYFPAGYTDWSNKNIEYLLSRLDSAEIPFLDLRKSLEAENIAFEDVFFKTDHHWTPQTGFWAYTKILYELEKNGAISEVNDFYTDTTNYDFTIYEDCFLGSLGKRTGKYFSGVDDFCLITPGFDTNISIEIPNINLNTSGKFEDVAYHREWEYILTQHDYFNQNPYGVYGWADRPLISWRNESAPEEQKVMLIGDSYGNVPFSLMSLYFTSCEELDMRHFNEDFTEKFDNYDPEVLIVLVNISDIAAGNVTYPFFQNVEN